MTLRESCPNCEMSLCRDDQYRCPDCGINLADDEKTTTGRDQR